MAGNASLLVHVEDRVLALAGTLAEQQVPECRLSEGSPGLLGSLHALCCGLRQPELFPSRKDISWPCSLVVPSKDAEWELLTTAVLPEVRANDWLRWRGVDHADFLCAQLDARIGLQLVYHCREESHSEAA